MKKILAVDDDPLVTKLIKINLELSDYSVEEAWDGDSALRILEKSTPDLLVLDLMMPRMDGWDILKIVREKEELKSLPVILLTAKVHDEDLVRGWEMGADDYITKPFNPIRLSDHVKAALESTLEERQAKRRRELVKLTGITRTDAPGGDTEGRENAREAPEAAVPQAKRPGGLGMEARGYQRIYSHLRLISEINLALNVSFEARVLFRRRSRTCWWNALGGSSATRWPCVRAPTAWR